MLSFLPLLPLSSDPISLFLLLSFLFWGEGLNCKEDGYSSPLLLALPRLTPAEL
jgi:hypothetical protein